MSEPVDMGLSNTSCSPKPVRHNTVALLVSGGKWKVPVYRCEYCGGPSDLPQVCAKCGEA